MCKWVSMPVTAFGGCANTELHQKLTLEDKSIVAEELDACQYCAGFFGQMLYQLSHPIYEQLEMQPLHFNTHTICYTHTLHDIHTLHDTHTQYTHTTWYTHTHTLYDKHTHYMIHTHFVIHTHSMLHTHAHTLHMHTWYTHFMIHTHTSSHTHTHSWYMHTAQDTHCMMHTHIITHTHTLMIHAHCTRHTLHDAHTLSHARLTWSESAYAEGGHRSCLSSPPHR